MMKLDKESFSALAKLSVFLVLTGLATALLMMTMSNGSFERSHTYKAVFTDATGVTKGDDVRIAGVSVGSVKGVQIIDRNKAEVALKIRSGIVLTTNTNVQIRFRNLVGQRYLNVFQGGQGNSAVLKDGATIGLDQTQEALDLTTLLNGFKPVFQALNPADTNKLAFELVQTLQGEGASVENLLARTASLTRTLADRDQLIGDVITNLSSVLDTIGSRDKQLTYTIDTLQQFVTGLKKDRNAILDSMDSISALTTETSNLLVQGRPDLAADVKELKRVTANLSKQKNMDAIQQSVQILPIKLKKFGVLASNGSMFNFYACSLNLRVGDLPKELTDVIHQIAAPLLSAPLGGERCKTGGK